MCSGDVVSCFGVVDIVGVVVVRDRNHVPFSEPQAPLPVTVTVFYEKVMSLPLRAFGYLCYCRGQSSRSGKC